jgi:hypothetical protein
MNFKNKIILSSVAALAAISFSACSSDSDSTPILPQEDSTTLSGNITENKTLTSDKTWILDGLVVVKSGTTLTIDAGTTIAGKDGTGAQTSYMIVEPGAKINAVGTADDPIIFTSTKVAVDGETAAPGQWGGLTIIGNAGNAQVKPYEVNPDFEAGTSDMADNSGTLKYVQILNSGITMEQDKEINGLSLVGVGSGTTIDNIKVVRSDDDCIELWGGTVNISNAYTEYCTDDQFDIDDGYSGTVTNLTIKQVTDGNAGIEMSGTTAATFENLTITQNYSDKEGTIYFKGDGIGGHFDGVTITDNVDDDLTIVSDGTVDQANISFTDVEIISPDTATNFTNIDAAGTIADVKAKFDAGTGNSETN